MCSRHREQPSSQSWSPRFTPDTSCCAGFFRPRLSPGGDRCLQVFSRIPGRGEGRSPRLAVCTWPDWLLRAGGSLRTPGPGLPSQGRSGAVVVPPGGPLSLGHSPQAKEWMVRNVRLLTSTRTGPWSGPTASQIQKFKSRDNSVFGFK